MLTRIITSVVALAVFVLVLLLNDYAFAAIISAVMGIMIHECMSSAKCPNIVRFIGGISSVLTVFACIYAIFTGENGYVLAALTVSILLHCAAVVALHGKTDYKEVFASCLLNIYIVLTMSAVAAARINFGTEYMMLIFVCAWMTDTGAYFTGRAIGKHKLIPHVSPNKTVEGAIGGVAVCMISCFVYSIIINSRVDMMSLKLVILGAAASCASQLGDLVASAIKRDTGVKDFGKIFPGHGGFMDRFDSVMFIAPIIYGLLTFLV